MASKAGGKGGRKIGRKKRKDAAKGSPISLFVRDKISAGKYWELTGQSLRLKTQDA